MHIYTTVKTRNSRRKMFEDSFVSHHLCPLSCRTSDKHLTFISSDLRCVSKYETFKSRMSASSQTNSKWLC